MKCRYFIVLISLFPFLSSQKNSKDLEQVESVLDRLEKRLLDQESQVLTFGEKNTGDKQSSKENVTKYTFQGDLIQGNIKENQHLNEIGQLVSKLETDIENLSGDVEKTKQQILENARINNFIEIAIDLKDSDKADIRSLNARLDGYDIYKMDNSHDLWAPMHSLPLYAGPMEPGQHKLEIDAKVVLKSTDVLPLNNDVYRNITKTFTITLPEQSPKKKWVVNLILPKDLNEKLEANLQE